MADETEATPARPAPFPPVDIDKGEKFGGTVEIEFRHPFRLHGALHDRARVRIPTGADLRAFSKLDGDADDRGIAIMTALTGLAPEVLDMMAGVDFSAVDIQTGEFLADAQATPKGP